MSGGSSGGSKRQWRPWLPAAGLLAVLALGCHTPPVQRVSLHIEPADARVFIDGKAVAPGTASAELRSDLPHIVLVKRDGYRPAQTVLETRSVEGRPRLDPAEVRLRLDPLVPKESDFRIDAAD